MPVSSVPRRTVGAQTSAPPNNGTSGGPGTQEHSRDSARGSGARLNFESRSGGLEIGVCKRNGAWVLAANIEVERALMRLNLRIFRAPRF